MGVSKSMKGQMGQPLGPDELRKFFAHTVRVNRGPVQLGKHKPRVTPETFVVQLIFHLYLNQGRLDVHAPEIVSLAPNSCSLLVIMAKAMGVLPAAVAVTLRAARP